MEIKGWTVLSRLPFALALSVSSRGPKTGASRTISLVAALVKPRRVPYWTSGPLDRGGLGRGSDK